MGGTAPYWRSAPSASRTAGPEPDLAGREVEREVLVVGAAGREVADPRPLVPALVVAHLEHRRRVGRDDGTALEREPLAGDRPRRRPTSSSGPASAFTASTVPPMVIAREARDAGRGAVRRLALVRSVTTRARSQPARCFAIERRRVALRDVDDDVAGAVEAARRVGVELARLPVVAGPRLPRERRVRGVDADALDVGS